MVRKQSAHSWLLSIYRLPEPVLELACWIAKLDRMEVAVLDAERFCGRSFANREAVKRRVCAGEQFGRFGFGCTVKRIPYRRCHVRQFTFAQLNENVCRVANALKECGIKRTKQVVAYCRIGERSSHTWFVLQYLMGYPKVKNYDGSWTEWGNLVGAPIAKGEQP